jgi:hypothetical protein
MPKTPLFRRDLGLKKMVRREGIEPATLGLKALISNGERGLTFHRFGMLLLFVYRFMKKPNNLE